jgi:hypothetical protein
MKLSLQPMSAVCRWCLRVCGTLGIDEVLMSTHDEQWERFLNPEVVRAELSSASMYVTTFEILKDSIVDRPKCNSVASNVH